VKNCIFAAQRRDLIRRQRTLAQNDASGGGVGENIQKRNVRPQGSRFNNFPRRQFFGRGRYRVQPARDFRNRLLIERLVRDNISGVTD
jgi:hypothetical protein